MVMICCVCGIEKGQNLNLTFHSFPKNEDLRVKWYNAIGKKVYRNACVCSKHFKIEDYRNHEDPRLIRRLLKSYAVPNNELCREFGASSFDTANISIGNKCGDSAEFVNHVSLKCKDGIVKNETSNSRVQADESSTQAKIYNPVTKRILDDEAILYSTAGQQTKKRKTEDYCTSQTVENQRYLNVVSDAVRKEDFKNVNAWLRFQKYINTMRKQYKFLLHKNRRLYLKLSNFKDMLETLKTK
ncbi:PREDICTED: uncharacterized protein LOC105561289 [Vollenhovia emeryi]|uniref:uncharacterized protein LOC105561289 n=1 Tax=Vollenhovia emeryi TaxID=411798 RepID=UPI0005F3BA13|nr:PREDICTED: uncharacterized protein LOC105561289 [Vollenhovia emeryi]